jgi:hypothetical protein
MRKGVKISRPGNDDEDEEQLSKNGRNKFK